MTNPGVINPNTRDRSAANDLMYAGLGNPEFEATWLQGGGIPGQPGPDTPSEPGVPAEQPVEPGVPTLPDEPPPAPVV